MSLKHSDEFKRDAVRIALTSGLTRRQVASDLNIGLSTLGKWIASISDETKIPTQDTDLLRENERLRKENRILRKAWEKFKNPCETSIPIEYYFPAIFEFFTGLPPGKITQFQAQGKILPSISSRLQRP